MITCVVICCIVFTSLILFLSIPITGLIISELPNACNSTVIVGLKFDEALLVYTILDIVLMVAIVIPFGILSYMYKIEKEENVTLHPSFALLVFSYLFIIICTLGNYIYFIIYSIVIFNNIECIKLYDNLSIMILIYFISKLLGIFEYLRRMPDTIYLLKE